MLVWGELLSAHSYSIDARREEVNLKLKGYVTV